MKDAQIRLKKTASELTASIAQLADEIGFHLTAVPGLAIFRREASTKPTSAMYDPCICVVAQGAKRVYLEKDSYVYDARHYLVTAAHLPTDVQVIQASAQEPCLGLKLQLDLTEMSQLMADSALPAPREQRSSRAMATGEMDLPLLSAFTRLIDLANVPDEVPILAPILKREIYCRLLMGEQGALLRQTVSAGNHTHRISRAIDWLKDNFTSPLKVEALAEQASMSTSTFHNHFRALTATSPLQYQKRLRLNEARRLMIAEGLDARSVAFQVGYESPSQFSREYSRLFGAPPMQDVQKLNELAIGESAFAE